jgi:hypothetical protein
MFSSAKTRGVTFALLASIAAVPPAMAQAHLRVPANQHVILLSESDDGTCCQAGQCFRFVHFPTRLLPDGKTEQFSIPQGKILVITDVEWNWSNQVHPAPNQSQLFRLFLGPNTANDVAKSAAMTDSDSFAEGTLVLESGFTVAKGTPVCGFFAFGESGFLSHVTLGGYLDNARDDWNEAEESARWHSLEVAVSKLPEFIAQRSTIASATTGDGAADSKAVVRSPRRGVFGGRLSQPVDGSFPPLQAPQQSLPRRVPTSGGVAL